MPKPPPDLTLINSATSNWIPREYKTPTGTVTPKHYNACILNKQQMKGKTEEE